MRTKILSIVANVMEVAEDDISLDSSPETLEAWDSLRHMNLVLSLEQELGVQFSEDQILRLMSVRDILDVVAESHNNA